MVTKSLFRDIVDYLPAKVLPAIVGVVALPIITRLLPPADYGNYILVISAISFLSMIAGWVGMAVLRFYPAYEKDGKVAEFNDITIRLTFLSVFVVCILSLIALFLFRGRISSTLFYLMGIGILVIVPTTIYSLLLNFLRIRRRVKWFSFFFIWKSITAIVFGVLLLIFFKLGVAGLLWGTVLSVSIGLPILWKIAAGRRLGEKGLRLQPALELAKYSFPLVISNLAAWFLSLSDRYLLGFFRGTEEVGIYSVSYQISDYSIMLFTSLFALAFGPLSIIVWEKEGVKGVQKFLSEGTRYFLILCIPAVVGISVLRKPVLHVLSTQNYYEGSKIIPFVVLGVFLFGLKQRFLATLGFYKKTYISMLCVIASGALNIGLNFLLIPKYGYVAAALTTLISYSFLLFLTVIISRRFLTWGFPFKSLLRTIIASGIMGVVVYYISKCLNLSTLLILIIGICMGVITYLFILILLREIGLGEIQAMFSFKKWYRR